MFPWLSSRLSSGTSTAHQGLGSEKPACWGPSPVCPLREVGLLCFVRCGCIEFEKPLEPTSAYFPSPRSNLPTVLRGDMLPLEPHSRLLNRVAGSKCRGSSDSVGVRGAPQIFPWKIKRSNSINSSVQLTGLKKHSLKCLSD